MRSAQYGQRPLTAVRTAEEALAGSGIFEGADPAAVGTLLRRFQPVQFPRGHVVFERGDADCRLYVIVQGRVKLAQRTGDDRRGLLEVLGPCDVFGELSAFDPGPCVSTATTLTPVRAVHIDRPAIFASLAESPTLGEPLLRLLARRFRRTNDALCDMIHVDVPGRLADRLLTLARRFGEPDGDAIRVHHGLTQEELAQLVGSSRETVNKALSDFTQRGWLRPLSKGVVIYNPARLARRAGNRAPYPQRTPRREPRLQPLPPSASAGGALLSAAG